MDHSDEARRAMQRSPQPDPTAEPSRAATHVPRVGSAPSLSPDDPMAKWLVTLQHDLLAPTHGILNHADALTISRGKKIDPAALHSVFSAARSLERNLRRVVDLAKLSTGGLVPAPEVCSLHSLTQESVLVARAMSPRLITGQIRVQLPSIDVISMLEKRILVELLATIVSLVYRASTGSACDLNLSFVGERTSTQAAWHIRAQPGAFPVLALDALHEDPRWASRHLFDLAFVARVAAALGGTVGIDPDRAGLVLQLPTVPVHRIDPMDLPRNVLWTTAPILMSSASPKGFTPVPGNVFIFDPNPDVDLQTQIEDSGARLFIAHHTPEMSPDAVLNLLITCVSVPVPVLLRSSALDYDTLSNFQDHVDVFLLEPCRRETLARYVVGLSSHDRRTNRRPAQIHT